MSELVREVVIDASPSTIFPFLTESDQLVLWMGTEAEIEARPGGIHRVLAQGIHPAVGEYVEVIPNQKVVYTFGWDEPNHPIPAGSTEVEILLLPEGEKTRVRLTHRGLPEDAVADHTNGWDFYLNRLSIVASGGDAGPDTSAT
jgi:uncharacterized protein YndB with AHSA1/START domain